MRKLSRRSFSRQFGKFGAGFLLAPFLATLEKQRAHADVGAKRAKRLFLFCTMGTAPSVWSPSNVSGENNFTYGPGFGPLAAIRGESVLIDGLASANPGTGHGFPDALTGKGYIGKIISVDQFASDQLRANGINRPIPNLLLGADARTGGQSMFFREQNLTPIASPVAAYGTVFGGAAPAMMEAGGADRLLKRRKSILDVVRGEVAALSLVVGAQEKAKLELHLDSIRNLENRLADASNPAGGGVGPACSKPGKPADDLSNPLKANLIHLDLMVSAFACDITRIGAVEFGSDEAMQVNLPEVGLRGEEHSGMIHNGPGGVAQLVTLEKWFSERFVELVKKLKSIPEADGSGTLFDNTLLVWCRDMGDAPAHNRRSMKYVLTGRAGGYLKTNPSGRYLAGAGDGNGDLHERLLLNMCEALGITNYTGFGDPNLKGAGKSPLSSLRT